MTNQMFSEEFVMNAMLALRKAKDAGTALSEHVLTCGRCEHLGGPDIEVVLCVQARPLKDAWAAAFKDAEPYGKIIEMGENMGGRA